MPTRKKAKKGITLDDLAGMTQRGFAETHEKIDNFRKDVDKRFEQVDRRFDIIEHKLIARHEREIEQLRDRLLKVETFVYKNVSARK